MKYRYFLRLAGKIDWFQVTREKYVEAERSAGMTNPRGEDDKPGANMFSKGPLQGKVLLSKEWE